jgi:putative hydrolase of the HAD superfamily
VEKLWNDHVANNFETGRMSPRQYFDHVGNLCQFHDLTFEEFIPIFNEIFEEDLGVVDLISKLKSHYRLGLISNTNAIHVTHILETYPVMNSFDRHWFSNEAGIRKPNPAIFEMALTHFSVEPSEAVFIDDMPDNVESAKRMGIHGILYQGIEPLKVNLSRLGVQY